MAPMDTPPPHPRTCRYGHGPLRDERGLWSLGGIKTNDDGVLDADSNTVYLLRLALCPVCGYVELFDSQDRP